MRAHKQSVVHSSSWRKARFPRDCKMLDLPGATLAGLYSCLLSLWVYKKHGCGRPIQQAMSNIGGNNPGTTHRATKNQKGDPEKGKEVCRALQMDRE